jgi:preprotein translocase subunit SecD
MCHRLACFAACASLLIQIPNAWGQQPRSKPLKKAEEILNRARLPSSAGLPVQYLQEQSAPKSLNLAGTTWIGGPRKGVDLVGGASDTWEFQEKGQLRFILKNNIDGERISKATWTQEGSSVTVKFAGSGTVYTGVIKGNLITGEARWTQGGQERTAPWKLMKR